MLTFAKKKGEHSTILNVKSLWKQTENTYYNNKRKKKVSEAYTPCNTHLTQKKVTNLPWKYC